MSRYLFENATIVDVNHRAKSGFSVLVDGGTIIAVENHKVEAKADEVFDLSGCYLMPGLIDAHIHLGLVSTRLPELNLYPLSYRSIHAATQAKQLLMSGFTSVRDAAGIDIGVASAIEDEMMAGPRIFFAGNIICKTGGHGDTRQPHADMEPCACHLLPHHTTLVADGIDACRKAARETLRAGATQIKVAASGGVLTERNSIHAPQFSLGELRAIVEEAEDNETYVMAHAHGHHGIARAVKAGVRSIEHCSFLNDELAELMLTHHAYMVPTLVVADVILNTQGISHKIFTKVSEAKAASHEAIKTALKHGVKLGLGSDTLGGRIEDQPHELTLRSEFQSPYDVLISATAINAEIMQQQNKLGVIKKNALADLIITDFDPTKTLEPFCKTAGEDSLETKLKFVMKGGKIYKNLF